MKINEILLNARKAKGYTQADLEELSGVGCSTIHYYENGRSPRLNTLIVLLDALGLKIKIVEKEDRN